MKNANTILSSPHVTMKTSLSHLPKHKQDELVALREIILAKASAEMIILFGSYARGEWVEDYHGKSEYVSDFDILIITKDIISTKQGKTWRELSSELAGRNDITRTSFIQHSIGFVNDKIEHNQYFFVDILKEGILLFDSGSFKLSEPKEMKPEERRIKARNEFEHWFGTANEFLDIDKDVEKGHFNKAVFLLHQATERYIAAILLVFTDYKPKIHDIEALGNQVAKLHSGYAAIFPRNTADEERLFQLLRKAYIDARYDKHYKIEKSELEYLGKRVSLLRDFTERICNERISQFAVN